MLVVRFLWNSCAEFFLCGARIPRASFAVALDVWCSYSPSFMCWCEGLLKDFDDLFWWKTPQPRKSNQVMTEDGGHQVKETMQEEQVESELMIKCLGKMAWQDGLRR